MMRSNLHWIRAAACRLLRRRHVGAFFRGWTLAACALFGGGLSAGSGAPAFELLPAVLVDSRGVYLHQIISTPRTDLSPIRLADAPAFGQTVSLSRAQCIALLQKAAPEQGTNISGASGAAQVRISRRARLLAETELHALLTATLQGQVVKDRGELELRLSRTWTSVSVPDEPLALKVLDLPASGVSPNFIARFEIVSGPDRVGPWQLVMLARLL
jgi:hypothetical protein